MTEVLIRQLCTRQDLMKTEAVSRDASKPRNHRGCQKGKTITFSCFETHSCSYFVSAAMGRGVIDQSQEKTEVQVVNGGKQRARWYRASGKKMLSMSQMLSELG
jgi:hypothetical protein